MIIQRYVQRALVGSVIVVAGTAIYPVVRQTLRPMVREISKEMNYFIVCTKERMEDMVAEVKFERMKRQLDKLDVIDCEVIEMDDEPQKTK
ncbi:hypothetical protein [Pontibacillus yanchengensis]|uniref:Uncharacterized protein n=1 Tax=Pontibacillus yanchengensis Y32 TaxID=1385514 RepID=A0A0A2TH09_9BACI|nr:hypothetical protein [Pontibacillus yanchengensis]KGP73743.1 hypothetical protein N782_02170 [Pontibacillus yanchengensis Y32]